MGSKNPASPTPWIIDGKLSHEANRNREQNLPVIRAATMLIVVILCACFGDVALPTEILGHVSCVRWRTGAMRGRESKAGHMWFCGVLVRGGDNVT